LLEESFDTCVVRVGVVDNELTGVARRFLHKRRIFGIVCRGEMIKTIKKAIIPVAGMGTRFLPATKAQPKEMLSVVDKPVIQYIVEEAVAAGIEEIIFVTAIGKRAIEDHFDRNFELEYRMDQSGKQAELEEIRKIGKLAKFAFVRQNKPLGDGHAILAAFPFVGDDESVAVFFGDDIITGQRPAIGELIDTFYKYGNPVVAVEQIHESRYSSYGMVGGEDLGDNVLLVKKFVEKPEVKDAPSDLGVVGRFIITPQVFQTLKELKGGKDDEIRLADAFMKLIEGGAVLRSKKISGKRFDCGNKLQFIIAQIELGLEHPEVKDGLEAYLSENKR